MNIHILTLNPFQENTYIIWDDQRQAAIIDPGCSNRSEETSLVQFIESQELEVKLLLNTHSHIDHILGNRFVKETYQVPFIMHEKDLSTLRAGIVVADQYGIPYNVSPEPDKLVKEGESIQLGSLTLDVLFTPGHSPGSICFIHHESKTIIGGDVLFRMGIGRYDFPESSYQDLMHSIKEKLFSLNEDYKVYPGHGPETSIGYEKDNNPWLQQQA